MEPKLSFSRVEVRRLLSVSERQLKSWEELELAPLTETYSFNELVALRSLLELRAKRIHPRVIRNAVLSLRRLLVDVGNPLTELRLFTEGRRIRVEVDGNKMEPITGQLLLNFDQEKLRKLVAFPRSARSEATARAEAERWFQRGIELEAGGALAADVMQAYQKAIELDPKACGALVNLGTIHFNAHSWTEAEGLYLRAIEADPEYALAHFNLGNLYDEVGERAKALLHYETAVRLRPNYGDAHYNLALLYQSLGEVMKAIRHWKTYLKVDPVSSWADVARRELDKLRRGLLATKPASVS